MLTSWSEGPGYHPNPRVVDILGGFRGKMEPNMFTPTRYVKLYFMFAIATVYIMFETALGAMRTFLVAHRGPFLSTHRKAADPAHRVEVIVKCGEVINRYLVSGETLIATRAARLSKSANSRLVTLDADDEELPALIIRIRVASDATVLSKLIFNSPIKSGTLRLFRRFGTDRIPIKPTENINVLTDTVQIGGSHFISFAQSRTSY